MMEILWKVQFVTEIMFRISLVFQETITVEAKSIKELLRKKKNTSHFEIAQRLRVKTKVEENQRGVDLFDFEREEVNIKGKRSDKDEKLFDDAS